jgi:hypothetical protein
MKLYSQETSHPKSNAQANLMGRTHYVDDDSLRFHKSKILRASHHYEGLLFSIVTSDAVDYQNTKRGFRFVIFNLFGRVIERTPLDATFRTSEQASKARYAALDAINAKEHTFEAISRERENRKTELDRLACTVAGIDS